MAKIWLVKSNGQGIDFGSDTHQATFKQDLKENLGKVYRIERVIPERTLTQNRYYWLYLGICEAETGNNAEDLHQLFKRTLLPPKFITVMGKELKIPASTTELTKIKFGEYLDKVCMETGVPLPDPNTLKDYIPN